jgi:hypothetical protein
MDLLAFLFLDQLSLMLTFKTIYPVSSIEIKERWTCDVLDWGVHVQT